MKTLRLPKILRFIPGTAQDVRAYFLTLQYWLAGSEDNIVNLVCCWSSATPPARARPARRARPEQPRVYPEVGLYHPRCHPAAVGLMATTLTPAQGRHHRHPRHGGPAADALLPAGATMPITTTA
jgi:magnesium chelatase subunit H